MDPENQDQVAESQTQELQDGVAEAADVEDTQDTQDAEVDAPEQSQEVSEAPESDAQQADSTTQESSQEGGEEEEEEQFVPQAPQIPQIKPVDINDFITDGNFDADGYNKALQAQMSAQMQAVVAETTGRNQLERQYEKEWDKAYDKFPQLKGNTPEAKQMRGMVQAIHAQSANPGQKYLSPARAASQFFDFASGQRKVGRSAATESRTVQASANLGRTTPPAQAVSSKNDDLKGKLKHGKTAQDRKDAAHELLKQIV